MGAALAYYAAFSLLPLLLVTASVANVAFGYQRVENQIVQITTGLVGEEGAQTLQDVIVNVRENRPASITLVVSVLVLLYSTTGLFRHLKSALNIIWNVPPAAQGKVKGFIRDTVLSFLMVAGMGLALLITLIINGALLVYIRSLESRLPDGQHVLLWQAVGVAMLLLGTTVIFATIYKLLPDADVTWKDVWVGALITALLFSAGQFALGLFLHNSNLGTVYGAASVFTFVLIWVHISAHLVLLGAEFTQVYANHYGGKIVPMQTHEQFPPG
jgi:membrane protein